MSSEKEGHASTTAGDPLDRLGAGKPPPYTGSPQQAARVGVVIPALDEESSLPLVLRDLPRRGPSFHVDPIVVVDNGSTDGTAAAAAAAGVRVVSEPRRGYGSACKAGLSALVPDPPDIVAFIDADWSDFGDDLPDLLAPILAGTHDLVIGSRLLGRADPGSVPPHVRAGNRLACLMMRAACGVRYTDLGPFRAVRFSALLGLRMRDPGFGWTVEMQVKATRQGLRIAEVPVRYRRRVGVSKISGTVSGTLRAGTKILWSVARYRLG